MGIYGVEVSRALNRVSFTRCYISLYRVLGNAIDKWRFMTRRERVRALAAESGTESPPKRSMKSRERNVQLLSRGGPATFRIAVRERDSVGLIARDMPESQEIERERGWLIRDGNVNLKARRFTEAYFWQLLHPFPIAG